MTCNPKWKKIQDELKENHMSQNRPDLIAWVFQEKLQDFKDQLLKKPYIQKSCCTCACDRVPKKKKKKKRIASCTHFDNLKGRIQNYEP